MKKAFFILIIVLLVSFALAEGAYIVNDRALNNMSVEELYSLEDSVVVALMEAFARDSTEMPDGELIGTYVVNSKTDKFHYPYCYSAIQIGKQRKFAKCTASELVGQGYKPCGQCNPSVNK